MNHEAISFKTSPLQQWHRALTGEGFQPHGGAYLFKEVSVERVGNWFLLKMAGPAPAAKPPGEQLGQPGFWNLVPGEQGALSLFEFPQAAVGTGGDSEPGESGPDTSLGAFLRWALAARTNSIPADWRPPPRELVESWLPTGALTVQCGSIVRQGWLILTPQRWALRFPILSNLPTPLPPVPRKWLHQVLTDSTKVWRMVRVGIADDSGNQAVVAEVDFTGAPHSEYLFLAGLDGVRHVVACLAEAVELVADVNIASQALAIFPHTNPKPERQNT